MDKSRKCASSGFFVEWAWFGVFGKCALDCFCLRRIVSPKAKSLTFIILYNAIQFLCEFHILFYMLIFDINIISDIVKYNLTEIKCYFTKYFWKGEVSHRISILSCGWDLNVWRAFEIASDGKRFKSGRIRQAIWRNEGIIPNSDQKTRNNHNYYVFKKRRFIKRTHLPLFVRLACLLLYLHTKTP